MRLLLDEEMALPVSYQLLCCCKRCILLAQAILGCAAQALLCAELARQVGGLLLCSCERCVLLAQADLRCAARFLFRAELALQVGRHDGRDGQPALRRALGCPLLPEPAAPYCCRSTKGRDALGQQQKAYDGMW